MRYGLWRPIPMWVGATRKWAYRDGVKPRAIVIHRMEGSLEGSDSYLRREFTDYYPFPRLSASTHFGVGLWTGVPQIRQWVDTIHSAFGWAASPTDVPDALARRVFSDQLYSKSTWPYWQSRRDLNRDVISIEVEGFAYQEWESRTTALVKELIGVIVKAHGPLTVVTHTCASSKQCPGMATFHRALPNYYGAKIGAATSPTTPNPMEGFPVQFRQVIKTGTIAAGVNIRTRPSLSAPIAGTTRRTTTKQFIGQTLGDSLNGKRGWWVYWSPNESTSTTWDGRLVYVHESLVR